MAGLIPISQASPLLTMQLVDRYDEMKQIKVNDFFSSFFKKVISQTLYPVVDVRRGSEKVAVEVQLGSQGNRNQITKYTQKAFDPFYFKEWVDATQLEGYFRVLGSSEFTVNDVTTLSNSIAIEMNELVKMIRRRKELMCASILEDGTITSLLDGTIIDFKRKAASIVDLGTTTGYWSVPGTNPFTDMKAGGDFLRQVGKSFGYVINVVMGTEAWAAFRNNTVVQERLKEFNNRRDMIMPAQIQATGAVYQGEVDCDSYMVRCWTYNDFYEDPANEPTMKAYMNPKKVYMLPEEPIGDLIYSAIPQVVMPGTATSSLVSAEMVFQDFPNLEYNYHRYYVQSRPLPVPIMIDKMYTMQVVA